MELAAFKTKRFAPFIVAMAWAVAWTAFTEETTVNHPDETAFFAGNEELRGYLLEAAGNHPKLQALHEEWLAALEVIPQMTSLEDPMFSYTQFVKARMDRYSAMLEQKLPWFGTRRVQGEQAAEEAEAARLRMFAARNEVFAKLKETYFEYAYLAGQILVTDGQLLLLSYAEETVRAKYSFGMATQDELLRIQTEQSEVRDMHAQLEQIRPALSARLNELLGRPLEQELPWPQECAAPPAPPGAPETATRIRKNNPDVLAMDREITGREKGVDLAKRKNYPDVTLRVEYMKGKYEGRMEEDPWAPGKLMAYRDLANTATGAMPFNALDTGINLYEAGIYSAPGTPVDDKITLGFSINLPVWRKRIKGGVQEALHRVRAAELNKEALSRALDSEARMTLFEIQDAQRRHGLYETDLLPKASQTYSGLQAAYASGEGEASFLDLLESVRALLEFELQQIQSMRDLQQASARLEMLLGGPWAEMP